MVFLQGTFFYIWYTCNFANTLTTFCSPCILGHDYSKSTYSNNTITISCSKCDSTRKVILETQEGTIGNSYDPKGSAENSIISFDIIIDSSGRFGVLVAFSIVAFVVNWSFSNTYKSILFPVKVTVPEKTIPVGGQVEATAKYNGTDKGNYVTEIVKIMIQRETCFHVS